jgi:hypothetical protein
MSLNFNTLAAISGCEQCPGEEKKGLKQGIEPHVALDLSAGVYGGKIRIRDV